MSRSTLPCTDLTTARRWMQHGKLVVVCSDTAQITKISQTTKENAFLTFFVCVPGLPARTHTHTHARTHAHTHTHTHTINIQFALTSAVPRSKRAAAQCAPRHGKEAVIVHLSGVSLPAGRRAAPRRRALQWGSIPCRACHVHCEAGMQPRSVDGS